MLWSVLVLFLLLSYFSSLSPFYHPLIFLCAWRERICYTYGQSGENQAWLRQTCTVSFLTRDQKLLIKMVSHYVVCDITRPNQLRHAVVCWSGHEFIFPLLLWALLEHSTPHKQRGSLFLQQAISWSLQISWLNSHVCCRNVSTSLNFIPRIQCWLTGGFIYFFFFGLLFLRLRHCSSV